jgi:hypothetical protein
MTFNVDPDPDGLDGELQAMTAAEKANANSARHVRRIMREPPRGNFQQNMDQAARP